MLSLVESSACSLLKGVLFYFPFSFFLLIDNQVMLRDVSADLYEKLGFLLNPASFRGSWIHLAGKLGYTNTHVANFKLRPMHSTQVMLQDWAQRADATVFKLYQAVQAIGREDAARELEAILVPSCSTV